MSIASQLVKLADNKAAIKSAIEAKSPTVPPTDSLAQWPEAIASIPSGGEQQKRSQSLQLRTVQSLKEPNMTDNVISTKLRILTPDDGMVLTDGSTYTTGSVYLAHSADASKWREIPASEVPIE